MGIGSARLQPALVALMQWGDRWTADQTWPPVEIRHRRCGSRVHTELACGEGHHALAPRETHALPGPGARRAVTSDSTP